MTFDEIRAAHPDLGLAVYAYEPGGPVTVEVHDAGRVLGAFAAPSFEAALTLAFPPAASLLDAIFPVGERAEEAAQPDLFA